MSRRGYSTLRVNLDAYAHNLRALRERLPGETKVLAVVKANGYGLGVERIAARALEAGAEMLGVATVDEGAQLRELFPEARILLLYQPPLDRFDLVISHNLRVTLNDASAAERLGDLARRAQVIVPVHCEVDTGMGRQGFPPESAVKDIQQLTRISNIDIEGLMTHFPSAETPDDPFTQNQIKLFRALLRDVDKAGIPYELAHAANSAAVMLYPAAAYTMVRVGLMSYGVWPGETPLEDSPVRPVVRWESRVTAVRKLPGGASVGYGRTFRTNEPTRAATVLVGYADGYPHAVSNVAEVLIRGRRFPVIGRVSMDAITIDVSSMREVAVGDRVTLMGSDGCEAITVEDMARWANTIPYEIMTGIGNRVTREYSG